MDSSDANPFAGAGGDPSVKDFSEKWGDRPPERRTLGNPLRTKGALALKIFEDMGFTKCKQVRDDALDLWTAEDGWETEKYIKGVAAAKTQTTIQSSPEEKR